MKGMSNAFATVIGPTGLAVTVDAGTIFSGPDAVEIPAQTVALQPNSTTYIFVDTVSKSVKTNTTGFAASTIVPLATVTTNLSSVTTLVDNRPDFSLGGLGPFTGDFLTFPPYEGTRSAGIIQFAPSRSVPIGTLAAMPVYVNRNITLTAAKTSITVPGTPSTGYYLCIYTGTEKVLKTYVRFPLDNIGDLTASMVPQVSLSPSVYLFAVGSDDPSTDAQGQNYLFDTDLMNFLPGGGMSTNIISNGVPPNTLGSVNEPWPYSAPFICLY